MSIRFPDYLCIEDYFSTQCAMALACPKMGGMWRVGRGG